MMKISEVIMLIIFSIVKRMSVTLAIIVEIAEHVYELMISNKSKATERMMRIFVILISGEVIEMILDTKIITIIEIIKIIEKFISMADLTKLLNMWMIMLMMLIKNKLKGENGLMLNLMCLNYTYNARIKIILLEIITQAIILNGKISTTLSGSIRSCFPAVSRRQSLQGL